MMNEVKIRRGVFITFSLLWMTIVFLDYMDKHPIYWLSVVKFKYHTWLIVNALVGIILALYSKGLGCFKKLGPAKINGLHIYLLFLFVLCFTAFSFNQYMRVDLNISHYLHLITRSSYTLLGGLIVFLSAFSLGDLLITRLFKQDLPNITRVLTSMALGLFVISLILFGIGAMKLLINPVVLAVLILPILINYKSNGKHLKSWFWKPYQIPTDWSFWASLMLYGCLVLATMNFFFTQAPFPMGFDARNYYINISQLLAQNEALVPGFQPYSWNLVASVGYIAFLSPEITLFLSTIGIFLSCWGIYELSVRYFKILPDYAIMVIMIFLLTPAIMNHWIIEFKVDLTLLFVQLSILCVLFNWISHKKEEILLVNRSDWNMLFIISLLIGFSLSIKVLSVFLAFGVVLVYFLFHRDRWGTVGIACLGISLPILMQLDNISGVRSYFDNPNHAAYLFATLGLVALGYSLFKNIKTHSIPLLKIISITGLVSILCFSPWVVKNYMDNPNGSAMQLLLGKKPQADINVRSIDKKFRGEQ